MWQFRRWPQLNTETAGEAPGGCIVEEAQTLYELNYIISVLGMISVVAMGAANLL